METFGPERGEVRERSFETEATAERYDKNATIDVAKLQEDLQKNYTEHLRNIEVASLNSFDGVIKSARTGFRVSLLLNVLSFVLGSTIIGVGAIMLWNSPKELVQVAGAASVLLGAILVLAMLFWKGPLDRILDSVSNLARINAITIGLAHRINQVSQFYVQEYLIGKMNMDKLASLNSMVQEAVRSSVQELEHVVPRDVAEQEVAKFLGSKIQT